MSYQINLLRIAIWNETGLILTLYYCLKLIIHLLTRFLHDVNFWKGCMRSKGPQPNLYYVNQFNDKF